MAATITVNTTNDELNGDGDCSLREAVVAANSNAPVDGCTGGTGNSDVIVFSPAVIPGTFVLTIGSTGEDAAAEGDLDILEDVTITGAGPGSTVIDGNNTYRVIDVRNDEDLTISGVTIRNGGDGQGAGLRNDGDGVVIISDCAVLDNAGSFGAGLNNDNNGEMHISDCLVARNDSTGFGGGISNDSGGIMTILRVVVVENSAEGFGGGVNNNSGGMMTITESLIQDNFTEDRGGGVNNNSGGDLEIYRSAIVDNLADDEGGGVYNNSNGSTLVVNSTMSGNISPGENGGFGNNSSGSATCINCTIANNSSPLGANVYSDGSGGTFLHNTIVAYPRGGGSDCLVEDDGFITSLGSNIDTDGTCGLTAGGDKPSVDPLLEELGDFGGTTPTHPLRVGSPAINMADNVACPETDQRGVGRGAQCDIGAYEGVLGGIPVLSPIGILALIVGLIGLGAVVGHRRSLG